MNVKDTVYAIRNASEEQLKDAAWLEELLPCFGLNPEMKDFLPKELLDSIGGVASAQYPNQFARYLCYIAEKPVNSYIEIGTRFGGTFIITAEYLARFNPEFNLPACVDIIPISDNLKEYRGYRTFHYLQMSSLGGHFAHTIKDRTFDLCLIDGNHKYAGCKEDYETMKDKAKRIVLHDIAFNACPGVEQVWKEIKKDNDTCVEFVDQYPEVTARTGKNFLGIGMLDA